MKKLLILLVLPIVLTACDEIKSPATRQEQQRTESNQQKMINAVPLPQLETSLERKNLVKRLEHNNREGLTGYIYLINYGKIMGYYTVDGKVSSLNSFLTGNTTFVRPCNSCDLREVESPDLDGAYGENDGGIFFFTTEGVYVEWHGDYLWTDQPMKLSSPPEMVVNL